MSGQIKFSVLCSLFSWMQRSKSSSKKRSKFRKFLDAFCKPEDYFNSLRLILPSLDRERGSYGLKESVLATCLIDALGLSKESEDALRLINWRKGGARSGVNAGNFALVAAEVLQRRQGMTSGGLTIEELNDLFNRLSHSENRADKTSVLSMLINKTNAHEMKWIVMIILKDLKLGIGEKSIFLEFHPDAEDLFNVTCDLRLVCEKLKDRNQRHKRQDIEVGKAVRPQLAMRVANASAAWKKLHGKDVVVECKFDGDRIQIHKNGAEIHFFSRNFLEHPEYGYAMSEIIVQNILVDRCILDGEMLVWDTLLNRFSEFGSNQEIAKAAKDGLDSNKQLCYVAFDILYVGDTSVIHQSLKERHELLGKVLRPLKGRLEILVPNGGLNSHRPSGEPCWSLVAHHLNDVERFFKESIENRDEGIVLKDLGSKWEPSDRSGKWLKLKPDYIRAGSDLDVLIIGGYHGSGRHGGEVAQFLMGLAECTAPDTHPQRFISFCRVSGLSDEELDAIRTKLKPYFRKYDYPKKAPPKFYQVTNNSKERPDVWIENPEKSIILSITSDIRTIRSEVFAAPYSLRFPRVDRVKYDKPWHECLDVQSFVELVNSSNGTTRGTEIGAQPDNRPKRKTSSRKGVKKNVSVPFQHAHSNISDIKGETLIFSDMMFYFVNVPSTHSLDSLHIMVVENGGSFSMNLNKSVTHCVASESKGIKYQAAKHHGDIIHYSWVVDCCSQGKLLHLQPKYFLFLSDTTKRKLHEADKISDFYYSDIDIDDIKQILSNMDESGDFKVVDYYKKKYCPKRKWFLFQDCCVYFHSPTVSPNVDGGGLLELGIRRMKLELCMAGGRVGEIFCDATHLVVLSVPGFYVDFETLLRSFPSSNQPLLCNRGFHVVRLEWLEDSLMKECKLPEDCYSIRPKSFECDNVLAQHARSSCAKQSPPSSPLNKHLETRGKKAVSEDQGMVASPISSSGRRKREGRLKSKNLGQGRRVSVNQSRRKRATHGSKAAKIYENESDEAPLVTMDEWDGGTGMLTSKKSLEPEHDVVVEDADREKECVGQGSEIGSMGDPVQAMLLDMIPSLGNSKTEKPEVPVKHERPELDPKVEPGKKKKVSYKDVVGDLLK